MSFQKRNLQIDEARSLTKPVIGRGGDPKSSLYKATPTAPVCSHAPVFAPALGPTPDKMSHCATCTDPGGLHVASIAMLVVGVVAPQLWNTRKVASKLTTSSCSNAAVGEKVARRRIEASSPRTRIVDTGSEGEHDQRHSKRANIIIIYHLI